MSEFQSVHFMAVDRPLDEEQLEFMREQSSRADITPCEFANEYHYGDFRGDPVKMLQRGYDVHLHYANFGIRRLMFRLPAGTARRAEAAQGVLRVRGRSHGRADKKRTRRHPGHRTGSRRRLAMTKTCMTSARRSRPRALRELLIAGDLRPLYLAWLACAYEDDLEPPVPAGLKKLGPSLEAMERVLRNRPRPAGRGGRELTGNASADRR